MRQIYKLKRGTLYSYQKNRNTIFNDTNTILITDENIIIQRINNTAFKEIIGEYLWESPYLHLDLYEFIRIPTTNKTIIRTETGYFEYTDVNPIYLCGTAM